MLPLLEMKEISKSFSGVQVLSNVQYTLYPGEVHALMGENGAGKSTLMKILGGIYPKDQGTVLVKGQPVEVLEPKTAQNLGIGIIHQELNLVQHMTVMENIFLGREYTFGIGGFINWRAMREHAQEYLGLLGLRIDPGMIVGELSVGKQQMVEIAKALSLQAEILVLDEPTAALTDREIAGLFRVIRTLKEQGVGMVYISHRMEEIFEICDRITVMRDGRYIDTKRAEETDLDDLVKMMVGREIKERFPKITVPLGPERLRVEKLYQAERLEDISLVVHGGEIVGIAGLMGAGRTELAKALCGVVPIQRGKILVDGNPVVINNPKAAIDQGIALVTEDRKHEGLVLSLSVQENVSLPNLAAISKAGFIKQNTEQDLVDGTIRKLRIKTADSRQAVGFLSGGNQQKVVIGKWLATNPKVLILDEPTRGVDIGAKKEIYDIMNQLIQQGVAIIMISSELPEVLGMSDRILVMKDGRITGEFTRGERVTQEDIMRLATGGEESHAN